MKNQHQLIRNIVGQLEGVDKMIDEEKECFTVLTQMKAARSAIDALSLKYIEKEFANCFDKCQTNKKDDICKKFFREIINN